MDQRVVTLYALARDQPDRRHRRDHQRRYEARQFLGRVLAVAVERADDLRPRRMHAGVDGGALPRRAVVAQNAQIRVGSHPVRERVSVMPSVDPSSTTITSCPTTGPQGRLDAVEQRGDVLALVAGGNDDRN